MDRKAVYMRNDVLFINAIIVITLLYSLIQGIQLIFMGSMVEKADAEIINSSSPFLALAVAHSKPRSLQPVMGQALPWGKLWTTASREEVSHKPL